MVAESADDSAELRPPSRPVPSSTPSRPESEEQEEQPQELQQLFSQTHDVPEENKKSEQSVKLEQAQQPLAITASASSTAINQDDNNESTYHLKWIPWNSDKIPIVMQSINGPCPLIATMNVLLLREKVKLPTMLEQITASQLLTYIGECIMDSVPADLENDENALLNLEQNIHDAMEILPKLKTGLDVNIRFTGITDFECTPECIIFDLLRIPLYHGWLVDPNLIELNNAIGTQSYNQLVDNIITNKSSQDPEVSTKILIAEEFLERTASQLTLHGLRELKARIKDNEIGILFRNNHFLTLFKRENEIYTLVTDHGYLTEDNIIWETLDNIEGAGHFYDSNFQTAEVTNRQVSEFNAIDQRQQQMVNDYLIALSLKEEETAKANSGCGSSSGHHGEGLQDDDFELAKRLQAEENRIYEEMVRERQVRSQNQQLAVVERQSDAQAPGHSTSELDAREWSQTESHLASEFGHWPELGVGSQIDQTGPERASQESANAIWGPAATSQRVPETSGNLAEAHITTQAVSSSSDLIQSAEGQQQSSCQHPLHQEDQQSPTQQTSSTQQQQQQQQQPRSHSSSSNGNRRQRSEKNPKDTNCIVG